MPPCFRKSFKLKEKNPNSKNSFTRPFGCFGDPVSADGQCERYYITYIASVNLFNFPGTSNSIS